MNNRSAVICAWLSVFVSLLASWFFCSVTWYGSVSVELFASYFVVVRWAVLAIVFVRNAVYLIRRESPNPRVFSFCLTIVSSANELQLFSVANVLFVSTSLALLFFCSRAHTHTQVEKGEVTAVLLVCKWGGEMTHAGIGQARQYAPVFWDDMYALLP